MGFSLEHFDVIGRWREKENGKPIPTAGLMPDGKAFDNQDGMKKHLLAHRDEMIRSIVKSLIAYGLGRESEFSDQDFIDEVVRHTRKNDYRFSALVQAFVTHQKFTHK